MPELDQNKIVALQRAKSKPGEPMADACDCGCRAALCERPRCGDARPRLFMQRCGTLALRNVERAAGAAERASQRDPWPKDRRVQIAPDQWPWSSIGRINVVMGPSLRGMCTGTLIGPRQVVTAAHCLFNSRTNDWAKPKSTHFVVGQSGKSFSATPWSIVSSSHRSSNSRPRIVQGVTSLLRT